jgi:hypothetical protein
MSERMGRDPEVPVRDYAAKVMYALAVHHTEGTTAPSRSHRAQRAVRSPWLWWQRWAGRRARTRSEASPTGRVAVSDQGEAVGCLVRSAPGMVSETVGDGA